MAHKLILAIVVVGLVIGIVYFMHIRQKQEQPESAKSNPQATVSSPLANPEQAVLATKSQIVAKTAETVGDDTPGVLSASNIPINSLPTIETATREPELDVVIQASPVGTSSFSEARPTSIKEQLENMIAGRRINEGLIRRRLKDDVKAQVNTNTSSGTQTSQVESDVMKTAVFDRVVTPAGEVIVARQRDETKTLPEDITAKILRFVQNDNALNVKDNVATPAEFRANKFNAPGQSLGATNKTLESVAPTVRNPTTERTIANTNSQDIVSKLINQIEGLFPKVNQKQVVVNNQ